MKDSKKPNKYWTKELCHIEALKYDTKREFENKSGSAYVTSIKNKWINEICSHMKNQGSKYLRFIYVFEFENNAVYIGLSYNVKIRLNEHLSNKKSQVYKHIEKTNSKYILKIVNDKPIIKEKAQILEHETKLNYIKEGWIILNKAKTGKGFGSLGGNTIKWTYEKCKEESLKYKTKSEFKNKSNGAYSSSVKNNWYKKITSHMIELKKPNGYWTKEKCHEEALKYKSKINFCNGSKFAYSKSYKEGWLLDVCIHMITCYDK